MPKSKYKAIKIDGVKHDYHRWLMEQELGRKLESDEVVHHIDGNKQNNDITNLKVISKAEHARMHATPPYFSEVARERSRISATGRRNVSRKLTDEDVEFIRTNYIPKDKEYGCRPLARKFGITHSNILKIINYERYKN